MPTSPVIHLFRRAGFGLSPSEWTERKNWTRDQGINYLFTKAESSHALPAIAVDEQVGYSMMSAEDRVERRRNEARKVFQLGVSWIMRMADPNESALLERISLFWHGHFACESKFSVVAANQLDVFRTHGLGHFRDLVLAVSRDPAMIRYLNNQQNKKDSPNENYARELMELFTIGRGHYTENDVKEAARAFTGWSSNLRGEYIFRRRLHDFGPKEFMGRRGNFDGEDIVDILLEKRETAYFITNKIYRYFVSEIPNERRVRQLADEFYQSDYHIGQLLRRIFNSDWFYDPEHVGQKIKSPVELMAGMIRHLNLSGLDPRALFGLQKALGQQLFKPPNVAGWPGGKQWIDNATLLLRLNMAAAIFRGSELDFNLRPDLEQSQGRNLRGLQAQIDLAPIARLMERIPQSDLYPALAEYLLPSPVPPPPADLINSRLSREQMISRSCLQLMSLPEYQMC
ncbi:MAG: DUF1800 domain-containing protein [Bacteroidota bacterium]